MDGKQDPWLLSSSCHGKMKDFNVAELSLQIRGSASDVLETTCPDSTRARDT